MYLLRTVLIVIVALSATSSIAMTISLIYNRHSPKTLYFTFLTLFMSFYMLGYLFEIISVCQDEAFLATVVMYLGMPYIAPFAVFFLADYYGHNIPAYIKRLMLIIPINATLMVALQPYIGIYYNDMKFLPPNFKKNIPLAKLEVTPSPIYYITFAYIFLLLAICLIIVIYNTFKSQPKQKKGNVLILISTCLPFFAQAMYLINFSPFRFDFTPFTLLLTVLLLGFTIFKLNLLQLLPLAKEQMLEQMKDAFIVVDNDNKYLDSNPAARILFPSLVNAYSGTPVSKLSGMPAEVFANIENDDQEVLIQVQDLNKYYRASRSKVFQKGKAVCTCIMFFDVTETKYLMNELRTLATYDDLTKTYNRGSFLSFAEIEFKKAQTNSTSLALFMIDIDFFKSVNDSFGHICGDKVLVSLSKLINSRLRSSDIFGRYGGEEFCICLSDINIENATKLAEVLRKKIEQHTFTCDDNSFNITISIGVSYYSKEKHSSFEDLLSDADTALYEAKNKGRNLVVVHNDSRLDNI